MKSTTIAGLLSLFLFCTSLVSAQIMIARYDNETMGANIQRLIANDSSTANAGTTWINISGGLMNFTRQTGGTYAGPGMTQGYTGVGSFVGYCIEPRQFVSSNTTYSWTVLSLGSTPLFDVNASAGSFGNLSGNQVTQLGRLFGTYYPIFGSSPLTAMDASALQFATWEIIRELPDNAFDIASGNIRFQSSISDQLILDRAQFMLSSLNSSSPVAQNLVALHSAGAQDMIVQQFVPVPEASTYGLMGAGALATVALFRRRRKTQK